MGNSCPSNCSYNCCDVNYNCSLTSRKWMLMIENCYYYYYDYSWVYWVVSIVVFFVFFFLFLWIFICIRRRRNLNYTEPMIVGNTSITTRSPINSNRLYDLNPSYNTNPQAYNVNPQTYNNQQLYNNPQAFNNNNPQTYNNQQNYANAYNLNQYNHPNPNIVQGNFISTQVTKINSMLTKITKHMKWENLSFYPIITIRLKNDFFIVLIL